MNKWMSFRPVPTRIVIHVALILIVLTGGLLGVDEFQKRRIVENELAAMAVLNGLASAEADFFKNDRDGNKVSDFWTADVAALHYLPCQGIPLRLIPKGVADADAAPRVGPAAEPIPYHGYFFIALDWDESVEPVERYAQDTDGKSGKTRNLQRFGFCAYPAEPGVSGKRIFIINENRSIFRTYQGEAEPAKAWPSDRDLKLRWGRSWAC